MTKKDYIKLAEAIKKNTDNIAERDDPNRFIIYCDAFLNDLCDILVADNKNFDKNHFLRACK